MRFNMKRAHKTTRKTYWPFPLALSCSSRTMLVREKDLLHPDPSQRLTPALLAPAKVKLERVASFGLNGYVRMLCADLHIEGVTPSLPDVAARSAHSKLTPRLVEPKLGHLREARAPPHKARAPPHRAREVISSVSYYSRPQYTRTKQINRQDAVSSNASKDR